MNDVRIEPGMRIPEVVSRYPSTREVFDRYGLKGCGGPDGPPETVEFFSRAHAVELDKLLAELQESARKGARSGGSTEYRYEEAPEDLLYRRFFKAGIVVALSVGCLFGAFILLQYAVDRSFFAVPIHLIHVHGHAQVFGWIGLIAMGFAYQAYPRFKHTTLALPRLAGASFYLMVGGLALRTLSQAFLQGRNMLVPVIAAGILEWAAVSFFVVVMIVTVRRSEMGVEYFDRFILTALGGFWLVSLLNPVMVYLVVSAPSPEVLIDRVATWFLPYRDLELLAFATMLIFGVSHRYLPAILGFRTPSVGLSRAIYLLFGLGIAGDIVFYLLLRRDPTPVAGIGWQASTLLMLVSAVLMVWQLGILRRPEEWDRSIKFIRAAYIWLLVAFLMLALMPTYNRLTGLSFSHAYFGAYRHALTVGFISMMILGVSSKVIPVLSGLDPKVMNPLNHAFYLLNVGNMIRVSSQIATDHVEWAFPIMGASGFIEVTALALWGIDIWRAIDARPAVPAVEASHGAGAEITADLKVADVLDRYPETEEVFLKYGFTDIQNPVLRRTVARAATLRMACGVHHVDEREFLAALNERIRRG